MARKKTEKVVEVTLSGIAHKGSCIGRTAEGMVVFTKGGVPGDVVEVGLGRKRKGVMEGKIKSFIVKSPKRTIPFCEHFGLCGGCSWQELDYNEQLHQKNTIVVDALKRIAKVKETVFEPIVGANNIKHYRNKLEFTFSNHRWLSLEEIRSENKEINRKALGFHRPESFDKVVNIEKCFLQIDISNEIRNEVRDYANDRNWGFYDVKLQLGFLRNIIVRTNLKGEVMLIFSIGEDRVADIKELTNHLTSRFNQIKSVYNVVNQKKNDTLFDLNFDLIFGDAYLEEQLGHVKFLIGPKSFFQTNPEQALKLYQLVEAYANIQPHETVYDLYCGVGSIGIFLARNAKKIVGIEEISEAIEDAKKNAAFNQISHAHFFAGDAKEIFNKELIEMHGFPDVLVVDPPRSGLHADVVQHILHIEPSRIIYVSCNPATQARDVSLFMEKYTLVKIIPVDMFPFTNHVESVGLLIKKDGNEF